MKTKEEIENILEKERKYYENEYKTLTVEARHYCLGWINALIWALGEC